MSSNARYWTIYFDAQEWVIFATFKARVFNASRLFGPRFFKDEVCAPLKLSHSDARFARILSSALRASLKEIGFFKLKKLSNTTRKLFNLRMSLIFATFKARTFKIESLGCSLRSLKEIGFFKLKKLSNTTRKLFNLLLKLKFQSN